MPCPNTHGHTHVPCISKCEGPLEENNIMCAHSNFPVWDCGPNSYSNRVLRDQFAEYGTFRRYLQFAREELPVCRCAPKISGLLVCTDQFLPDAVNIWAICIIINAKEMTWSLSVRPVLIQSISCGESILTSAYYVILTDWFC